MARAREYQQEWRRRVKSDDPAKAAENAEKHAERQRAYYEKNKERIKTQQAEYRARNKAKIREQQAAYRASAHPKIRARRRRTKYGICEDVVQSLLEAQGGACAICHRPLDFEGYRQVHVDHCHSSNKVRGVLCRGCNVGLGQFREEVNALARAISYLRANKVEFPD